MGWTQLVGAKVRPTTEELVEQIRRGQEEYGVVAPYPLGLTPGRSLVDGVRAKKRGLASGLKLPRVGGVGDVERERRVEALHRLAEHAWGEREIGSFEEMDECVRLAMAVPRPHAVMYHRRICQEFERWMGYCPNGRGAFGQVRNAYKKALQFLRAMEP